MSVMKDEVFVMRVLRVGNLKLSSNFLSMIRYIRNLLFALLILRKRVSFKIKFPFLLF